MTTTSAMFDINGTSGLEQHLLVIQLAEGWHSASGPADWTTVMVEQQFQPTQLRLVPALTLVEPLRQTWHLLDPVYPAHSWNFYSFCSSVWSNRL